MSCVLIGACHNLIGRNDEHLALGITKHGSEYQSDMAPGQAKLEMEYN